jgi:hypothetical protein
VATREKCLELQVHNLRTTLSRIRNLRYEGRGHVCTESMAVLQSLFASAQRMSAEALDEPRPEPGTYLDPADRIAELEGQVKTLRGGLLTIIGDPMADAKKLRRIAVETRSQVRVVAGRPRTAADRLEEPFPDPYKWLAPDEMPA